MESTRRFPSPTMQLKMAGMTMVMPLLLPLPPPKHLAQLGAPRQASPNIQTISSIARTADATSFRNPECGVRMSCSPQKKTSRSVILLLSRWVPASQTTIYHIQTTELIARSASLYGRQIPEAPRAPYPCMTRSRKQTAARKTLGRREDRHTCDAT